MSSEYIPPRTAVRTDIADPVLAAREELKAALAAIEQKANIPRRVAEATQRGAVRARVFAQRQPVPAAVAAVAAAAAVGTMMWGVARLISRR